MAEMIPVIPCDGFERAAQASRSAPAKVRYVAVRLAPALLGLTIPGVLGVAIPGLRAVASTLVADLAAPAVAASAPASPSECLASGDGYLHARLGGAIDAVIDWPNSGTRCAGETKSAPPGVRLSFQRVQGGKDNLLFVFGITGVREGQPAHAAGVNLTLIIQGTTRIFSTRGDSRCTIDSLQQKPLPTPGSYRVEARGFCTQPAHAVRGDGDVLVSTFEFAGPVNYASDEHGVASAP